MLALPSLFIDGQEGTTGLRIREMIAERDDVELLLISDEERKDPVARAAFLNRADVAILCLPDDAAAEAVGLIENPETRVIDTSTARRVAPEWIYGLPEVSRQQKEAIRVADRIANCGCYPVGYILAVRPLVEAGLIDPQTLLTVNAASGYSGGGRRMIEAGSRFVTVLWDAPDGYSWDSHRNSEDVRDYLIPGFDQAFAALIGELEDRGLLDPTLVIVTGEMGRTPRIGKKAGRDHWPQCGFCLMLGGGTRRGVVHGTTDKHAGYPIDHPVSPGDLVATIYTLLGVDADSTVPDRLGRPIGISHGGRPIEAVIG